MFFGGALKSVPISWAAKRLNLIARFDLRVDSAPTLKARLFKSINFKSIQPRKGAKKAKFYTFDPAPRFYKILNLKSRL